MNDTDQTRRFGPRVSVYREDLDCVVKHYEVGTSDPHDHRKLRIAIDNLKRANTVFLAVPNIANHKKQLLEDKRLLDDARENPGNSMLGSATWVAAEKKRQRWIIETEIAEAIWQIDHADK